jgi:hypothetical protein
MDLPEINTRTLDLNTYQNYLTLFSILRTKIFLGQPINSHPITIGYPEPQIKQTASLSLYFDLH